MEIRRVFLDIEVLYDGDMKDRQLMFKDFNNWKFVINDEYLGDKVIYEGIIGMLIIDCDYNKEDNIYQIINKNFIQLVGYDVTKDNLMNSIGEFNEIIHYHGRSIPNHKGYIGFDLPIINAQLGILLDVLQGVKSIDLELICHRNGLYGGQKAVENTLNIERSSGITDGLEASKLIVQAGRTKDKEEKKAIFDKILKYNKEDVAGLVKIEQMLRKIRYKQ